MEKIDVAGLKIAALTKKELLDEITGRIKSDKKTFIITPYSEFLYHALQNPELMRLLNSADIAVPDGIGILWAAKFLQIPLTAKSYLGKIVQAIWQIKYSLAAILFYPKWIYSAFNHPSLTPPIKGGETANSLPPVGRARERGQKGEKISGSDLIWDLARLAADNNFSIYLLGGFRDTPELVSYKLKAISYKLRIAGYSNKNPGDPAVIEDIKKAAPDFLFVAYGPFKQERFIAANLPNLPVKLAIGLGGTFDYIAGKKAESPQFLRKIGLEWLWRLFTQPRRIKRIWQATFGLMSYLLRYKVFSNLPLRTNVAAIILNRENQVLICERNPKNFYVDVVNTQESLKRKNYWQFPQGGVDGKENLTQAAKREAQEETGIKNLEFIKISAQTHTYIWNNALRGLWNNRDHANIGQIQHVVYFKFLGTDNEIKVDNHEFINYKWATAVELDKIIHPERINLVKIVQDDLNEMREKGIING